MRRFLKEPLLHFLLIGAALFLYYSQVDDSETVVVTADVPSFRAISTSPPMAEALRGRRRKDRPTRPALV